MQQPSTSMCHFIFAVRRVTRCRTLPLSVSLLLLYRVALLSSPVVRTRPYCRTLRSTHQIEPEGSHRGAKNPLSHLRRVEKITLWAGHEDDGNGFSPKNLSVPQAHTHTLSSVFLCMCCLHTYHDHSNRARKTGCIIYCIR